jgi:hypothetical protein
MTLFRRVCGSELRMVTRVGQPPIKCLLPRRHEGSHEWNGGKDQYAIWSLWDGNTTILSMHL